MNAERLQHASGQPADVWVCQKCSRLFTTSVYAGRIENLHEAAFNAAERCCRPWPCACCQQLLPLGSRYTQCQDCRDRQEQRREEECFAKAQKLSMTEYADPCFLGDEFYWSAVDFQERWESNQAADESKPAYLWCAEIEKFAPDPSHMLENALENQHEGAADLISRAEYTRLATFVEQWAADQNIRSWTPDYTRCVLLDWEEPADQPLVTEVP